MTVIDEIKDRLDIVEVVGAYVQLKKAGRSYKGLCPFHNEKTPSFVVFPDSQNWRCFGACGTGGDMFSFVMKRENVDFGDALALLAGRAGVELKPQTEAAGAEEGRLERLRAIQSDTAVFFSYLLNKSEEATLAREYLERRGLTRQTWETWQLGYALDSWDALKNRLQGKGYTPQELEEAGVVIRKEETGSYYDRFRGRLMIPIRDGQGRTIGFGARILREDGVSGAHAAHPGPKYMNSPQTPLFDKGNVLFGLDMAKKAIRDANLAVIVEGYMDVLMSHQVGVTNVVAGMGTALTEAQMRQIKRYTSNVTLALDPDIAGEHAAGRGLEAARHSLARDWEPVFSPTGLLRHESRLKAQLRIAALPDGLDPDELAHRDVDRWREVIRNARPIVDYYLALAQREEDLTSAQGKAQAIERLAPLIQEIANPIERTHYVQALARLVQMDERLVTDQVARGSRIEERAARAAAEPRPGRQPVAAPGAKRAPVVWSFGPEEYILGWLTLRPELLAGLDEDMIAQQAPPLSPDDLSSAENQALLAALLAAPGQPGSPPEDRFVQLSGALLPAAQAMVAEVRGRPPLTDEKLIKDLGDSLLRIRERNLKRQVQQLEFLIRESTAAEDRDESRRLHELMTSYTAQKRHIQKLLNMRSIAGVLAQRKPIGEG
jgi:DNA primase